MESLLFFEKPGCKTNRRQKELLKAAGIEFEAKNLLKEPWTRSRLQRFFTGLPVEQWFNQSAPDIKAGKIRIADFDEESALDAMLKTPLLIKRPLFECGDLSWCGFDTQMLQQAVGVDLSTAGDIPSGCSHHAGEQKCP